ncbi:ABC transporter permease [Rubrimonas sp.]|uniref:ABC transporter permease n=1 Tax=Rubrimonas sp. TaxID=2036015 RepID=UPI002FDDB832
MKFDAAAPTAPPAAPPARLQALRWRARLALRDPATLAAVALSLVFAWLIVAPVVSMLAEAVRVQFPDARRIGADPGSFTTYYVERALISRVADPLFWTPLRNTLAVALAGMALALALGGVLAWLLARSDMGGRRWFASALIVPYILPGWTFALAWTTLFKNRSTGGHQGWFEGLGFSPPDWLAYGGLPIAIVMGLHYAPFVILLVGGALRNMDAQLEEQARVLGATQAQAARRIALPLMRPALVSAAILVFAECIGDFGVPYVLGLPVNFDVLSTSLYRSVGSRQTGMAAVIAAAILLLGAASLAIDLWLLREARRFAVIGAKGAIDRPAGLGAWRWPAAGLAGAVVAAGVAIPLGVLTLSTLMRAPGNFAASNFTLDYWIGSGLDTVGLPQGLLISGEFWAAAWNTLRIVGTAALLAGLLGLMVGHAATRTPVRWLGGFLRQVTFLPYLVPGVAFAFAYLTLFAVPRGPIPALYGTTLLLVLALVADQMPFASRAGISAMMQLGRAPEEAAQVLGAGFWSRMRRIVLPIQRRALFTAVLLPFISGAKNLTLFALLAVPGLDVLTTFSLRLVDYNYLQAANGVVLTIALISFAGALLGQRLLGVDLAAGLGR